MLRKTLVILGALAVLLPVGGGVSARRPSPPVFTGFLTCCSPSWNDFQISPATGANATARSYISAHGSAVSIAAKPSTTYSGPLGQGHTQTDHVQNDFVRITAKLESDHVTLDAISVKVFLERFDGQLQTYAQGSNGDIIWTTADSTAQKWILVNPSDPMHFLINGNTSVVGTPQVGDTVTLFARSDAPLNPTKLNAIELE